MKLVLLGPLPEAVTELQMGLRILELEDRKHSSLVEGHMG